MSPPPTALSDPSPAARETAEPTPSPRPPHWPALDGLRGLAVAAVIAYHLGHVPGGFLGVDLFFVLSGFLITSLLLREHAGTDRIDLRRFWERRARRLLPALAATLVAVVVAARVGLDHSRLPALRWDALTTAGYVANWRYAWAPVSGYFAADPSPLRHTWSLAIEEQYYVVWPLVAVGVLALARRRRWDRATTVAGVALVGVVASTAWMVLHAGSWSVDRLYLGTDTRVAAPLMGALLACLLHRRLGADPAPDASRPGLPGSTASVLTALAVAGLGAAVFLVHAQDEWLYRGGFLAAAALAAGAVAGGVLDRGGPAARVLASGPLRWVGERSYGLYLYSWPVQVVAEAQGVEGAALTAVTLAVAVPVAAASYRWLEMPIRRGRSRAQSGDAPRVRGRRLGPAVGAVSVVLVAVVVAGTITDARPDPLKTKTREQLEADVLRPPVTVPPDAPLPGAGTPLRVLLVGDSVGYTLGVDVPAGLDDIASVDSRALPGCALLVSGARPQVLVDQGFPGRYDDCAEPVAAADDLGLAGQPDIVLLVAGAWEMADHERDGRTVGPDDAGWTTQVRDLLAQRVEHLSRGGAAVALWVDACGRTADERRRQAWYRDEVVAPVAAIDPDAVVVDPRPAVCRGDRPITDVPGVGDPRPEDGKHWSDEGAAWLWEQWLGPALRTAHVERGERRAQEGLRTLVVGDSIGFTLDFRGVAGATDAGVALVPGAAVIGCGLVREGRSFDGSRDLTQECGTLTGIEDDRLTTERPEVVLAMWGAWEIAGASDIPAAGDGVPGDAAYEAYVRGLMRDRLVALGAGGATVAVLGVDCWPPDGETRSVERLAWWRALSRTVADEVGATYLDPTDALCVDGRPRSDVPGVGDPRPGDGAHWSEEGARWFWREWLGPRLHELAPG